MHKILPFLAFLLALLPALGQTRIKDLPLSSAETTNTSFVIDDGTYGARRVTISGLVDILEANGITGGASVGKLDATNGIAYDLTAQGTTTISSAVIPSASITTLNSIISAAEIGTLDGMDENIFDALLGKQDTITGAATTIDTENLTASRALESNASGKVAASAVTSEELANLTGSRDNIQDQIDAISAVSSGGTNSFVKLATMSALVTLADDADPLLHPDVVFLVEYWSGLGKGGGRWYKDTGSSATTNGAVIAINGGGRYLPVWDNYEVDVTRFGAKGDGATTDSTFFTQAATMQTNNAALWTYFPGYTYRCAPNWPAPEGFRGRAHPSTRIQPTVHPSALVDPLNDNHGVWVLTNNCIVEFNGGGFDGRRSEISNPGGILFAMLKFAFCSNVIVNNVRFENYTGFGALGRYHTNCVIRNAFSTTGAGGSQFYTGQGLLLENWISDGLVMNTTEALGILNCAANTGTRIINPVIRNIFAGTNANYSSSALNMFGETSLSIINPQFQPMAAGSQRPVIAILIDGGSYNSVIGGSVFGWNQGNGAAIELAGAGWALIDGVQIDAQYYAPGDGSAIDGSAGILVTAGDSISTIDQFGGSLPTWISRATGWQQRGQSTSHDCTFRNIKVKGYYDGVRVKGGVRLDFDNCDFSGNWYGGFMKEEYVQAFLDEAQTSKFHVPTQIRFLNCKFNYNKYTGLRYHGGQEIEWINCQFNNNDQGATGRDGFETIPNASGAFTSTGSQTVGNVSGRTSGDDVGKVLWIPSVGEQRRVTANTSTTITVNPGFTAAMANGVAWYLVEGMGGTNLFRDCQFIEDQVETFTGSGSVNPTTDISVAGTPFVISSTKKSSFVPGQRIKLVGVLSGGTDLTVEYLYPDNYNPDMMWVVASSPTTGTFTTTAGTAIVNGAGSISYTYNNNTSPTSVLIANGTSTLFGQECDGHYWIQPGTNTWNRILKIPSNTQIYVSNPWGASFTGNSYKISKFNMVEIQNQRLGYDIKETPSQFNFEGSNRMTGNRRPILTPTHMQEAVIDYTTAPNATARLTINSATPTLQQWNTYRVENTSSTTLATIQFGYEGQVINLLFPNSNTSIGFGSGNIRGGSGTVRVTNGGFATAIKIGTNWNMTIRQP